VASILDPGSRGGADESGDDIAAGRLKFGVVRADRREDHRPDRWNHSLEM
jgi:hypothetical protein